MGPIADLWGLEQGGIPSSEFYKVYNNIQLEMAQASELGVDLGGPDPLVVSSVGQADDVGYVTNDIFALQNLLDLAPMYCKQHHVTLRADKTKLQVFSNKNSNMPAYYAKVISPINMDGITVSFVEEAEHVGLIRSTSGNLPHILNRFTSHKRSLAAVLPVGLARGHRGNIAASVRIHHLYALPVLFSGLPSLFLANAEIELIDSYLKAVLQNLQKLMDRTPACVVYFLGGSLPGTAILHLRQLNLFGMLARQEDTILQTHGKHVLTSARSTASSWFQKVRDNCLIYQLPHPLAILDQPLSKQKFNRLVKARVTDHWEVKLRSKAAALTSAPYFKPQFMSLIRPHPIWSSCGSNPFECHKAVITTRMLSGRYLTDKLQRHWTHNKAGTCLLPDCFPGSEGSLEHLLLCCEALSHTRSNLMSLCFRVAAECDELYRIITCVLNSDDQVMTMQFLLDCTVMPEIIRAVQVSGSAICDRLLYIGRIWCYNIHRERMTQLGLLDFR
jgi:hypothetical protein